MKDVDDDLRMEKDDLLGVLPKDDDVEFIICFLPDKLFNERPVLKLMDVVPNI